MNKPTIILSGGGTMGSVMPLVALWERLGDDFKCIWIGSRKGVEKSYIEGLGIKYLAITSAKFRRYFDFRTFFAPLFVFLGFLESLRFLAAFRPKALVVTGSFVSVPLVLAAWICRVPVIVHQEDLRIGLAGRLTLPFASVATFAFQETMATSQHKNKFLIGNPVRRIFEEIDELAAAKKWKEDGLPFILVLGGSLGAQKLNEAMAAIVPDLAGRARIFHLTGKNKTVGSLAPYSYQQAEGLWGKDLAHTMAAADIVISRAGMSTISELAALGKPAILAPLADVGQKENAAYLAERGAALVADDGNVQDLKEKIIGLLENMERRRIFGENIKKIFSADAAEKLAEIIKKLLR